jgi:hypothetical protein
MDYLQLAISRIDQSEGDVTNNYQAVLIRQAELYLQISIAQSLAKIANELEMMNSNNQELKDARFNRKINGA